MSELIYPDSYGTQHPSTATRWQKQIQSIGPDSWLRDTYIEAGKSTLVGTWAWVAAALIYYQ